MYTTLHIRGRRFRTLLSVKRERVETLEKKNNNNKTYGDDKLKINYSVSTRPFT